MQIICSGRRPFLHVYDLGSSSVERLLGPSGSSTKSLESFAVCTADADTPTVAFFGDQGHIPLLSLRTRQWAGSLKMNGTARCGAFSADGQRLVTSGGGPCEHVHVPCCWRWSRSQGGGSTCSCLLVAGRTARASQALAC